MKRHTELRTTTGSSVRGTGRRLTVSHPQVISTREGNETATTGATGGVTSMFSAMERLLDESLQRPWLPFRHLLRDIGTLYDMRPAVDMFEEKDQVVVRAELPGLRREEITVNLTGNTLEISGKSASNERVEHQDYLRLERHHGSFRRILELPAGIDAGQTTATFRDGVLEVRIPRLDATHSVRHVTVE